MPLTSAEVAERAGITYRQLDYWSTRGYVDAPPRQGSGRVREWTEDQAADVAAVAALVRDGVRVEVAAARASPRRTTGIGWPDTAPPALTGRT